MAGNHATGMPIAYEKSADARQKRWGKRFQAVLAEIAKPKARGTPSSSLWFFVLLSTRWASLKILKNRSKWLPHVGRFGREVGKLGARTPKTGFRRPTSTTPSDVIPQPLRL